jgi:predicted ATPase
MREKDFLRNPGRRWMFVPLAGKERCAMIRLIEALNYRCLRYVHQPLQDFQILIGPNASGKTTFLDVVAFLGDLLAKGLDDAITERSTNIQDLFFLRQGTRFELAVEMEVPPDRQLAQGDDQNWEQVRYEVAIGMNPEASQYEIFDEQVILISSKVRHGAKGTQRSLFPAPPAPPESIMHPRMVGDAKRRTVRKVHLGNDNYYAETASGKSKGGWAPSIRLGPRKSALANMPDDEANFPATTWMRDLLIDGTQKLMLNSLALRQSSRPGQGQLFKPDGSNLPWVIEKLRKDDPARFREWIEQLQTALPDIDDVMTAEFPDTRHRFLQIVYRGGLKVPSWTVSDGTLRMLALTLPAYLTSFEGVYLIEEPENGIHPMAMETVYQALRSVYNAQILLATHSPVILGCSEFAEVLCFKKDQEGATDVVLGTEHPALRAWQDSLTLSDLYASGVLG